MLPFSHLFLMRVIEIIEEAVVKARMGRKGQVESELFSTALDSLNRVYEKIYSIYPWDNVKLFDVTVSQAANTGEVVLPSNVDIIRAFRIGVDVLKPAHEIRVNEFAPDLLVNGDGTPAGYMYLPDAPVAAQPVAASLITLVSSSTADAGTTFPVHIEGVVSAVDDEEEIDLNGTTNVTTTKSFTSIRKIVKPLTTGRITVSDAVPATLGTIAPWDLQGEYKRVQLVPAPDEAKTITIQCTRRFERLVSNNDASVIPEADGVLVDLVVAELLEAEEQEERAQYYRNKANETLEILRVKDLENQSQDFYAAPEHGMFGDLGSGDDFRTHDTSVTGIHSGR